MEAVWLYIHKFLGLNGEENFFQVYYQNNEKLGTLAVVQCLAIQRPIVTGDYPPPHFSNHVWF